MRLCSADLVLVPTSRCAVQGDTGFSMLRETFEHFGCSLSIETLSRCVVHGSPHGCLAFRLNVTVSFSSRSVSLSHSFWLVVPRTPFLLSVVPVCVGNPLWLGNTRARHGILSFACQASSSGPQQDKSTYSSGTSCWRSIEFVAEVLCSLLPLPCTSWFVWLRTSMHILTAHVLQPSNGSLREDQCVQGTV